jgi:hypothetical protein
VRHQWIKFIRFRSIEVLNLLQKWWSMLLDLISVSCWWLLLRIRIRKLLKLIFLIALIDSLNFFLFKNWKIIKDWGVFLKFSKDINHLTSFCIRNFLSVSTVSDWLIFIQSIGELLEMLVYNIFNVDPFYSKCTLPFLLLCPVIKIWIKIYWGIHLSYSTKLCTLIDTKKEEYWIISSLLRILIDHIQFFIAFFCAWPYLIDHRLQFG